jgi:hypothetical protein
VKRLITLVLSSVLLGVVPAGCVYDPDQRCGPHQQLLPADRCACEAGYVPGDNGCVACGEDERESNGECVCAAGYARPAQGAACAPIPAELGAACDADSAPCPDGEYPLCHATKGSAGYCTNACASSDECDGGYRCHVDGAEGFCRRPPLGYGDSCETDQDCAAGEATFCETIQSHLCLVPCAAGQTAACFEGEVCCDYAVFNPVCVPADACSSSGGAELR